MRDLVQPGAYHAAGPRRTLLGGTAGIAPAVGRPIIARRGRGVEFRIGGLQACDLRLCKTGNGQWWGKHNTLGNKGRPTPSAPRSRGLWE